MFFNIFKAKNINYFLWSRKKHVPLGCYPENNLFTLRKLIPIEDLERLPAKVVAFFYVQTFPQLLPAHPTLPASGYSRLADACPSGTEACLCLMKADAASPCHPCRCAHRPFPHLSRPQPQEANAPRKVPAATFGNNEKIPQKTRMTIADGLPTMAPT